MTERTSIIACVTALVALACCGVAAAADRAAWMLELENVCLFIPSDWLDEEEVEPTPEEVKEKYGLSNADIVDGLDELARKFKPVATNFYQQASRGKAIRWIGEYGTTNDIGRLSSVITNSSDHAQKAAVSACLTLLRTSPELIPTARGIVTNDVMFSERLRVGVYVQLSGMLEYPDSECHVEDESQRARIAAFFKERAAVERSDTLYIDECACNHVPSYRHSQQRRDNLAALRPPDLTGRRAELYDAAQRDAAEGDRNAEGEKAEKKPKDKKKEDEK